MSTESMSPLRAARAEAVLAHLAAAAIDGGGPYWALAELGAEFVTAQGWTPAQLDGAIDTLAAAGRVQLDGEGGQVFIMLVPEVSGLAPWRPVAA